MTNNDISAIALNNTIQLIYGDKHINIQKDQNPVLFDTVLKLITDGNTKELKKQFDSIRKQLEKYTKGNFVESNDSMHLKGDTEVIPALITKKLLQFKNSKKDFMPLVRFWKKLKLNPDKQVREQLYPFMEHNKIQITPLGDIVCEKGVKELSDGRLVDQRTGSIDNSIGMVVEMERSKVNPDPNQTCEAGLHVAAPDFVRKHWSSGVLIEVLINPADFVAVPIDYNNTKARVCRYQVIGLAAKEPRQDLIYNFDDIIEPTYGNIEDQKKRQTFNKEDVSIDHKKYDSKHIDFSKMTAQKIKDYVQTKYGVIIDTNNKNKQSIIKQAEMLQFAWSSISDAALEQAKRGNHFDDVFNKVKELITKVLNPYKPLKLELNTILSDVGCDSLDFIELIRQVEQEFDIEIYDEYAAKIKTVSDLVNFIMLNQVKERKQQKRKLTNIDHNLTAQEIKDYILKDYGISITKDNKNKRGIIKDANNVLVNLKPGDFKNNKIAWKKRLR